MADIIATVFRFRQFLFEFGPLFLASWLGLAVVFGLTTVLTRHGFSPRQPVKTAPRLGVSAQLYHKAAQLLWRLVRKRSDRPPLTGLFIFSLSAAIPALVVTSLINMEVLFLRLMLTVAYAVILGWFISRIILRQAGENSEQNPGGQDSFQHLVSGDETSPSPSTTRVKSFTRVSWRSFTTQFNESLFPIIVGFTLASVLTIYIPAYWVRPLLSETAWYGPYLAAALAIPFQLSGGAEVAVASALLVKGASLGTALSVMMAAPSTTVSVIMWLRRSASTVRASLYIFVAWLVAGSLGVIVNSVQSLFAGGL